jgi:hypothetical protein
MTIQFGYALSLALGWFSNLNDPGTPLERPAPDKRLEK